MCNVPISYPQEAERGAVGRNRAPILTGKAKRKLLKDEREERKLKADEDTALGISFIGQYFKTKMESTSRSDGLPEDA